MQHPQRLYFDITDILKYAENHTRVTGVQRVQLRLLSELVRAFGSHRIKGLANWNKSNWQVVDLGFLQEANEFNNRTLLANCAPHSFFPNFRLVRNHLQNDAQKKIHRGFRKALIYARALYNRRHLRAQGLIPSLGTTSRHKTKHLVRQLAPTDVYVALGTNWDIATAVRFCNTHHAQGGLVVQMMHDLIPYTRPDLHTPRLVQNFNHWMQEMAPNVGLYLCVSRHTQQDLRRYLAANQLETPSIVTPLAHEFSGYARGATPVCPPHAHPLLSELSKRPFILCVGSIEIRKNGDGLLKAWLHARQQPLIGDPLLVFAGRRGWKLDTFDQVLAQTHHGDNTVRFHAAPTDEELAWLYAHALFTVYPSHYEGWGLPVGESAWFHTPCLASSATSVPEVCGDLAEYASPVDSEVWGNALARLINDPAHRLQMRSRLCHAELTTWSESAKNIIEAIDSSTKR